MRIITDGDRLVSHDWAYMIEQEPVMSTGKTAPDTLADTDLDAVQGGGETHYFTITLEDATIATTKIPGMHKVSDVTLKRG